MSSRTVQLPEVAKFNKVARLIESEQKLSVVNAQGSQTYDSESPTTIRIDLPRSGYLNAKESYFSTDLKLTIATDGASDGIKPGAMSLFKSVKVYIGGRLVEFINDSHVLARMISEVTMDNDSETHAQWSKGYDSGANLDSTYVDAFANVCFTTPSGFLNSDKLIPLWALPPVSVELEMNTSAEAVVYGTFAAGDKYELQNVKYHAEIHELPRDYNAAVSQEINDGGLEILFDQWESTAHVLSQATEQAYNVSSSARSATGVFMCQRANTNLNDGDADYSFIRDDLEKIQLEIGPNVYPNQAIDTGAQAFLELQKAVKHSLKGALQPANITRAEYYSSGGKSFYGINLERFLSANQIAGEDLADKPMRVRLTFGSTAPGASDNRFYVFVAKKAVMKIMSQGRVEWVN